MHEDEDSEIHLKNNIGEINKEDSKNKSIKYGCFLNEENFISQLVIDLLALPSEFEVYDYILEKLEKIIKDSCIFIARYEKDSDSFKVYDIAGVNAKMISLGEKITGVKLKDFNYPMSYLDYETKALLLNGKLQNIDEGLYFIFAGKINKKVCKMLEKAFSVGDTYIMGFGWKEEMFGSVNILLKKESKPIDVKTIETYLNIASVVLQQKRAEKELRERENLLTLVTDNMLNIVSHINPEGIFQYISPSVKNVLGYEVEEVVGKNVFEFINFTHPDDLEEVMSTFIEANISYRPGEVQHRFKRADGKYIWVKSLGNPIFSKNNHYEGVVFSMIDIDSLKSAKNRYKSSLEEKELLMKELHHRVKNNMQIISSLLNLQGKYVKDERDARIFQNSQERVKTMAIFHEKLYNSSDLTHIELSDYIKRIVNELFELYNLNMDQIKIKMNIADVMVDMETAIPLGLLINEIVGNSLGHAFPDNIDGEVSIEIQKNENNYILSVIDNGVGIPEDVDFFNADTLGFQLVNNLSSQIDGEIELDKTEGTKFTIKFKEQEYEERIKV